MTKSPCTWLLVAVCIVFVFFTQACTKEPAKEAATAENQASAKGGASRAPETNDSSTDQEEDSAKANLIAKKWTGDLDGMIQRRLIRVLTVHSKTGYFVDRGTQRGLTYEAFQMFEEDLNKKLHNKHVRVQVVIVPVANNDLIPALLEGRGDIVAAGKLVTEWRREKVDFTNPTASHVSAIVVTGPGSSPLTSVEDLGGKEVYLRMADLSQQGIDQFNAMLSKAGKPPVKIKPAPEVLADEDLLEMVNAGLVQATIVHDYIAEFWQKVLPDLVLNKAAA